MIVAELKSLEMLQSIGSDLTICFAARCLHRSCI